MWTLFQDRKVQYSEGEALATELKMLFFEAWLGLPLLLTNLTVLTHQLGFFLLLVCLPKTSDMHANSHGRQKQ